MNRTQQPNSRPSPREVPAPQFTIDAALCTPSSDASRSIFAPVHYESQYAYPLIVWLHGQGADERQLLRVMPIVSMRNYVAVAPRGLPLDAAAGQGSPLAWPMDAECLPDAEQRVFEAIEEAQQKYHVARQRVFIAGFDCGGTMAFRLAMSHPHCFAGVLSLGGAFPRGSALFGRLAEARRLPIFLAVGRDAQRYSPAQACEDLRLLHTAGMSIILRQYPCGDELMPHMLRDMDRWIIEQITAPERRPSETSERPF